MVKHARIDAGSIVQDDIRAISCFWLAPTQMAIPSRFNSAMALSRSQHLIQRETRIEVLNLDLIRLYRMPSVTGDVQSVSADPRREP